MDNLTRQIPSSLPNSIPALPAQNGDIRIRENKYGTSYKWIRLSAGRWIPLHRKKWVEKYGSIPSGMVLSCKTSDTLNTEPENWDAITPAENMRRNRRKLFVADEPFEKRCQRCGEMFETVKHQVRICDDCREKRPRVYYEKTCPHCGTDFKTNRSDQIYCSHQCTSNSRYRQRKAERTKLKNCAICDHEFEFRYQAEKYCSDKCRKEAGRIANQAYKERKNNKQLKRSSTNDRRKETVNPENMPVLNRVNNRNDRDKLKKAKIKSPDHTQMPFKYYDEKLRIMRYFRTPEKYNKFLSTLQTE